MSPLAVPPLLLSLTTLSAFAAWTTPEFKDTMKAWAASEDLVDPNDALATWRDSTIDRVCDFDGILCDYYYDYYWIEHLDLSGLDLTGAIPPWMWASSRGSINLSNNQWWYTTAFYEDMSSGSGVDAMPFLKSLNCSNCNFFLKAPDGETILPDEWSRYSNLENFDISRNTDLIGQLPNSWASGWQSIKNFWFWDTSICEPFPFPPGNGNFQGSVKTEETCPPLPEYAPWEVRPPEPPAQPPTLDQLLHCDQAPFSESYPSLDQELNDKGPVPVDELNEEAAYQPTSEVAFGSSLADAFVLDFDASLPKDESSMDGRYQSPVADTEIDESHPTPEERQDSKRWTAAIDGPTEMPDVSIIFHEEGSSDILQPSSEAEISTLSKELEEQEFFVQSQTALFSVASEYETVDSLDEDRTDPNSPPIDQHVDASELSKEGSEMSISESPIEHTIAADDIDIDEDWQDGSMPTHSDNEDDDDRLILEPGIVFNDSPSPVEIVDREIEGSPMVSNMSPSESQQCAASVELDDNFGSTFAISPSTLTLSMQPEHSDIDEVDRYSPASLWQPMTSIPSPTPSDYPMRQALDSSPEPEYQSVDGRGVDGEADGLLTPLTKTGSMDHRGYGFGVEDIDVESDVTPEIYSISPIPWPTPQLYAFETEESIIEHTMMPITFPSMDSPQQQRIPFSESDDSESAFFESISPMTQTPSSQVQPYTTETESVWESLSRPITSAPSKTTPKPATQPERLGIDEVVDSLPAIVPTTSILSSNREHFDDSRTGSDMHPDSLPMTSTPSGQQERLRTDGVDCDLPSFPATVPTAPRDGLTPTDVALAPIQSTATVISSTVSLDEQLLDKIRPGQKELPPLLVPIATDFDDSEKSFPPSSIEEDKLNQSGIDCHLFNWTNSLHYASRSSLLSVNVKFDRTKRQSSASCDRWRCRLECSTATSIEGPGFLEDAGQWTWTLHFNADGQHNAVFTINEPDGGCTRAYSMDIVIDTVPPVCTFESYHHIEGSRYIVQLNCSEDVSLTDIESVRISKSAVVEDGVVDRNQIRLTIHVVNVDQSTVLVRLQAIEFRDAVGNVGISDVDVTVKIRNKTSTEVLYDVLRNAAVDDIVSGTIAASGGFSTGAAMLGSAGSGSGFGWQSNVVRAGFHLQFLAFTARLAVPALSKAYVDLADQFSWTTLAFGGTAAIATERTENKGPTKRLQSTSDSSSVDAKGDDERGAFIAAVIGYGLFISSCLCLRIVAEVVFRSCLSNKNKPDKLIFPRLELQAVSVTIPPMAFASARVMTSGSIERIELGLLGFVFLVFPFTFWYVFILTLRQLIIRPEIYFSRCNIEAQGESEAEDAKENASQSVSSSDELIAAGRQEDVPLTIPWTLPKMTHAELFDDYSVDSNGRMHMDDKLLSRLESGTVTVDVSGSKRGDTHASRVSPDNEIRSSVRHRSRRPSIDPDARPSLRDQPTIDHCPIARSDRWGLKERRPRLNFIKKYGFVFDDILGDDPSIAKERLHWKWLVAHAAFFSHKVASAIVFGFTVDERRSPSQVTILLMLHLLLIGHLLIVRPYVDRWLMRIETVVQLLELMILIGACLLLLDVAVASTNFIMICSFLSAALVLGLFEFRHLCMSDPTSVTQSELNQLDASFLERGSQELPGRIYHSVGLPVPSPESHELQDFWKLQLDAVEAMRPEDLRNHCLPLARIKKIMKSDEDVRMISAEAPVLFSKACEIFILELTRRAWVQSEANKRRTLQRSDIASAITAADVFDFLVDIVPRDGTERLVDSGSMEAESQPQHHGAMFPAVISQYPFQNAHGRHGMGMDPTIIPTVYQPFQCPQNVLPMNSANSPSDCASGTEFGKSGTGKGSVE